MRSAVRRAIVATTAMGTVLLLGACSSTTGTAAAGSGATATAATTASATATATATASSAPVNTPTGGAATSQGGSTAPVTPTQAATAPAAPAPVLGSVWASGVQGYGQARPNGLSNNGDPTGIVTGLSWSSWGGSSATGTGRAEYVAPGQSVAQGSEEQATVVAFDLGTCNGKPAYRAVEWYFPAQGQHFDPAHYFDACSGQDHGM